MTETAQNQLPGFSTPQPIDLQLSVGTLVLLELEKIRESRFLVRIQLDPGAVERMASTIQTDLLYEPVITRPGPAPDTYELLSGRLRVEAFRLLRDRAQTPEERQKYSAIPARVLQGVDDKTACRRSITSNAARVANNPLEMSDAVMAYIRLSGEDPKMVAMNTGLTLHQVEQLVRLADAPDFIKQACGQGLGDELPARASGEEREELARRRLELSKANELLHGYEHLTRHSRETNASIRNKLKKLVRQVLVEDWPFKQVEAAVRELTGHRRGARGKGEHRSGHAATQAPDAAAVELSADMAQAQTGADGDAPAQAPDAAVSPAGAADFPASTLDLGPTTAWEFLEGGDLLLHTAKFRELSPEVRGVLRHLLTGLLGQLEPEQR